jgi:precorrin-3B synthase
MTAPQVKGWCPGALRPMESGDGWVVRIRPRGGRLTRAQAEGIAALAEAQGNGLVDISARANVQLRGITPETHTPLIHGLRALGLVDPTPEAESRRNVTVTPFHEPGDGTAHLATLLEQALTAGDAPHLPGKFGFTIDTGPTPVLRDTAHDIAIERDAQGLLVRPAGTTTAARAATPEQAVHLALTLARWFLATGGAPANRGRMAAHTSRTDLPAAFRETPVAPATFHPAPGPTPQGRLLALAFGQTDAATLAALATKGPIRLTPWRMVLVESLHGPANIPGLIDSPADPLLNVIACTGAPGCPQGIRPTRPLARALAPRTTQTLHLSGCAKGCAHPGAAPLTLTATETGWRIITNGTAADHGVACTDHNLEHALAPYL